MIGRFPCAAVDINQLWVFPGLEKVCKRIVTEKTLIRIRERCEQSQGGNSGRLIRRMTPVLPSKASTPPRVNSCLQGCLCVIFDTKELSTESFFFCETDLSSYEGAWEVECQKGEKIAILYLEAYVAE